MRALLIAAALPGDSDLTDLWHWYRQAQGPLSGWRVHDPFAGGGSTLVEAGRLGAAVTGCDIDPLAVEIIRHELAPMAADTVRAEGHRLLAHLQEKVGHLYPAEDGTTPLHYFWVHEVTCPICGQPELLYRDTLLARDKKLPGAVVRDAGMTVFCPLDRTIHELSSPDRVRLDHGDHRVSIRAGTFKAGRFNCPSCGAKSSHRELQSGVVPRVLIAVEETSAAARRRIRAPGPEDHAVTAAAEVYLRDHAKRLHLPCVRLSEDRQDPRPLSFGIDTADKLFTPRQLAVFGTAWSWLETADLKPGVNRALMLGLSNALATNNKLCSYAVDYGRLSALFSVRGYSIPALPVELNPLHPEGGRGTIALCVERVARSAAGAVHRHIWSIEQRAVEPVTMHFSGIGVDAQVRCQSADAPPSASEPAADLCVFDPPYFDYISYGELSEFYRSWLPMSQNRVGSLVPHGSDQAEGFGLQFAACLRSSLARLALGRPLAFTYHSANPEAWRAVAIALDDAKLAVTGLWPFRSDGHMGHHSHPGNCEWDIVVVCRRLGETVSATLIASVASWVAEVFPRSVGDADRTSMGLAIATAAPRYAEVAVKRGVEDER